MIASSGGGSYGVILCPRCGRALGVRLGAKTASCQCGKSIPVPSMKVLFATEDPRELPEALGRIRAQQAGQLQDFEEALEGAESGGHGDSGTTGGRGRDPREEALRTLRSLSERGFTISDAERALRKHGLRGREIVEALQRENLLYEFRPGLYRVV